MLASVLLCLEVLLVQAVGLSSSTDAASVSADLPFLPLPLDRLELLLAALFFLSSLVDLVYRAHRVERKLAMDKTGTQTEVNDNNNSEGTAQIDNAQIEAFADSSFKQVSTMEATPRTPSNKTLTPPH